MKSITALAAVAVTGLPPKVEMVRPVTESATSGVATVNADGAAVGQALGAGDDVRRHAVLLDAEPLAAGAPPAGLHFVADEDAAVIAHDLLDDLEVLLGRRDEAAHALNRLGDEAGDAPAGGGADQLLQVLRAAHLAVGIGEAERAAIAVGVVRVHDAGLRRVPAARRLAR